MPPSVRSHASAAVGALSCRCAVGNTRWPGRGLGSLRRMPPETFKREWLGWARSSEGYAVRLMGRADLQYKNEFGVLHISAEPMSKPMTNIVVQTSTIPDGPGRSREDVVSRLRRAFEYRGWSLIEA